MKNGKEEIFLKRAIELAFIARNKGEDPFGAVLVKDGEIVYETHDGCIESSDPTLHAERRVISEYCKKEKIISLEEYELYSSTEPCSMCSGAIHWAKISKVVYSVTQEMLQEKSGGKPKIGCEEILNSGNRKIEIIGPLLSQEGLKVYDGYKFISKKERHDKINCK